MDNCSKIGTNLDFITKLAHDWLRERMPAITFELWSGMMNHGR
jgi:hypothetical protein